MGVILAGFNSNLILHVPIISYKKCLCLFQIHLQSHPRAFTSLPSIVHPCKGQFYRANAKNGTVIYHRWLSAHKPKQSNKQRQNQLLFFMEVSRP